MVLESILKIIEVSLHLIDRMEADKIKNEIISLRTEYAEEMSKPYDDIDDARLYSIKLRLSSVIQLYSTAAQGAGTKT